MKTSLAKAVALAATLGAAASAHAVNVNPDGLGQVLLYPVYTTEGGNYTAVHVTNTTNETKAVKVRFVEGLNSQEVLDFNLYLSPQDVWTGIVERTATGAKLKSFDKSCTVGTVTSAGVDFRATEFSNDKVNGTARTRLGHLEVIEMGVVPPTLAINAAGDLAVNAILHAQTGTPDAGVPNGCAQVTAAWRQLGNRWNPGQYELDAPTGGLYGSANIVNVERGTEIGFDAVALANFTALQQHTKPGTLLPSLISSTNIATFPDGTALAFTRGTAPAPVTPSGIDAVSAVLSKSAIQNDFAVGAGLAAQTDWVVTFPTKRHYVNEGNTDPRGTILPFTGGWSPSKSEACEAVTIDYWDREELPGFVSSDDFSPQPEQEGVALCYETNVVGFANTVANTATASNIFGGDLTRRTVEIGSHQTGWARIGLVQTVSGTVQNRLIGTDSANDQYTIDGLPVIGFAVSSIENNDINGEGVISNYAGSWVHKAETLIAPL